MKKINLFFLFLLVASAMQAQLNFQISALVLTKNYQNVVPNHPVLVIDSASGANPSVTVHSFTTGTNGTFTDSITTGGNSGTLWFMAPDSCGFTTIVLSYSTNSPGTLATAGLVLCNNIIPTPLQCNASFIIDTVNSQPGTVYVWNTSAIAGATNSAIVSYDWDFGDGTTSNQPFPSHNYQNPGSYAICLTITASVNGLTCASVYCDSLTVDQNGNIVYKGATIGWNLVVLDPNSIGVAEIVLTQTKVYPNPVTEILIISLPESNFNTQASIYSVNGNLVKNIQLQSIQNNIDVTGLPVGMYILRLESQKSSHQLKFVKQ